jgi:N-acyl-D-amino-acid deacylase
MYDIVVRGGLVFDGTGSPGRRADVALDGGRIVEIGTVAERGSEEIDAGGLFVSPGFIDGHTHLDAQLFWDPLSESVSSHGVTTVLMGNCGFTLAPGSATEADLVIRSIERSEDMSRESIVQGVPWSWTTFPEFLDAVDALPKSFNCAGYVGHSALRAFVMGERAFTDEASPDEIAAMTAALADGMRAGAFGFSTSRSFHHQTLDDRPVASRVASWDEVRALVLTLGRLGAGTFQLAPERLTEPEERQAFFRRLQDLLVESGRPAASMCLTDLEMIDAVNDPQAGSTFRGQAHVRAISNVYSFEVKLPFDRLPLWGSFRSLPADDQRRALTDPELRARLVEEALYGDYGVAVGAEARAPDFEHVIPVGGSERTSVAKLARERGTTPVDVMIDLALETGFRQCFEQPLTDSDPDRLLAALRHPATVIAASDSGAHVSQILDSNIPAYLLSHWVREREALTWEEGIRMLTRDPALAWGFPERGLLEVGRPADVVVFDPDEVGSTPPRVESDLPDGGKRLKQLGKGFEAVIVNGRPAWRSGVHTGDLPGRLVRGPLAAR